MPSTKNHTFLTPGERLKYAFGQIGISQGDAAKSVFVTPGQISKWVLNQNAITPNAALAFEARLGIRADWVLNGDGAMLLTERPNLSDGEKELLDAFNRMSEQSKEHLVIYAQGMADAEKPRVK